MPYVGQIGGDPHLIEFDAWSAIIADRDGFRMDPWEGRDPATGAPTEEAPSAMRVTRVLGGNDVGMVAYDEEHRSVVVFADDDHISHMQELGAALATELGCEFAPG